MKNPDEVDKEEILKFAAMAATSQCQLSAHLNLVELNYTVSIFGGTATVSSFLLFTIQQSR